MATNNHNSLLEIKPHVVDKLNERISVVLRVPRSGKCLWQPSQDRVAAR
jgi:hypothetical protein